MAELFYHSLRIPWCHNDLYKGNTYIATLLEAKALYNARAFRDYVARIPNAYLVGPGDGICWRDEAFDAQSLNSIAMFTEMDIPFYNPAVLWQTMEHKRGKKGSMDAWHLFRIVMKRKAQWSQR